MIRENSKKVLQITRDEKMILDGKMLSGVYSHRSFFGLCHEMREFVIPLDKVISSELLYGRRVNKLQFFIGVVIFLLSFWVMSKSVWGGIVMMLIGFWVTAASITSNMRLTLGLIWGSKKLIYIPPILREETQQFVADLIDAIK